MAGLIKPQGDGSARRGERDGSASAPFTHLGRYKVLSELGRGAMGVVYLAEDESLQRQVAIKTLLLPDAAGDRALLERASCRRPRPPAA